MLPFERSNAGSDSLGRLPQPLGDGVVGGVGTWPRDVAAGEILAAHLGDRRMGGNEHLSGCALRDGLERERPGNA